MTEQLMAYYVSQWEKIFVNLNGRYPTVHEVLTQKDFIIKNQNHEL